MEAFEGPLDLLLDLIRRHQVDIYDIPIADSCVDLVMARSVIEHVTDPAAVYAEMYRVLKPGGSFLFLTANFWDYASLIAASIPNFLCQEQVSLGEGYLKQPFVLREGYLDLPTGPGLGIELDENALAGKIGHDWKNAQAPPGAVNQLRHRRQPNAQDLVVRRCRGTVRHRPVRRRLPDLLALIHPGP